MGTHLSASPVRIPASFLGHQQRGQEEENLSSCVANQAVTLPTSLSLCPVPNTWDAPQHPLKCAWEWKPGSEQCVRSLASSLPWVMVWFSLHRPDTPEVGSDQGQAGGGS